MFFLFVTFVYFMMFYVMRNGIWMTSYVCYSVVFAKLVCMCSISVW